MVNSRIFFLTIVLLSTNCTEVTDDELKTYAFSLQGSITLAPTYVHVALDIPLKPILDMSENVDNLMEQLFSTEMHQSMMEDLAKGLFFISSY